MRHILIAAFIVIAGPNWNTYARPITVEDTVKASYVRDRVVIDKVGDRAMFQYEDPGDDPINTERSLKSPEHAFYKILTLGKVGQSGSPLFPQSNDLGYEFISIFRTPLSPSGRYLAFFERSRSSARLGIVDLSTDEVRYFGPYGDEPRAAWVDDTTLLLISSDEPQNGHYRGGYHSPNARNQMALWQRNWKNQTATANLIGGGKYLAYSDHRVIRHLNKVSLESNKVSRIASGFFQDEPVISPDGRYAVVHTQGELIPLGAEHIERYPRSQYMMHLDLFDLESGSSISLGQGRDVIFQNFQWSQNGRYIAYASHPLKTHNLEPELSIYDIRQNTESAVEFQKSANASSSECRFGFKENIYRPIFEWFGDKLAVRSHFGGKWTIVDPTKNTNRIIDNPIASARPIAVSEGGLHFVQNGQLWKLDSQGFVRISKNEFPSSASLAYSPPRGRAGQLPDIKALLFSTLDPSTHSQRLYQGRDFSNSQYQLPVGASIMGTLENHGIAYHEEAQDGHSRLTYVALNDKKAVKREFEYNEHFRGVRLSTQFRMLSHQASNGEVVNSWLLLPPWHDAEREQHEKYSLIVIPYPSRTYSSSAPLTPLTSLIDHGPTDAQLFAAQGYAVLLPSIPFEWDDAAVVDTVNKTVEAAVSAAVDTGTIRQESIAVIGHSFGGFAALALGTGDANYKAIVAASGFYNRLSYYGELGPGMRYDPWKAIYDSVRRFACGHTGPAGTPWAETQALTESSPAFSLEKIHAPVFLIHGDLDFISPAQPEQVFAGLLAQNKDVLFARYFGEHHTLSSPKNIQDMWMRIFDFLEDSGVPPSPKTAH